MATRTPRTPTTSPVPIPPTEVDPEGHELRMSLIDHLLELRNRIVKAVLALLIGVVISFLFTREAFLFLLTPFCEASLGTCTVQTLTPTEGLISYLRVSLLLGAIIAIPVITYQLLMFIIPGLTKRERRAILMAIPAITILFLIGVWFAWFVLIPPALGFLANFQTDIFKADWTADAYLSFVTSLLFWMGAAFQTPLIFFTLSLMGLITAGALLRQWRLAIVGSAVAAALITPTVDPINMFLVVAPLLVLYAISIVLAAVGTRRFNRAGQQVTPT
jgi:sec-independent protein translocase protein TatC